MSPEITIIVTPRERFSHARTSLESLYAHTRVPFRLVYVDGGSPASVRDFLAERSRRWQFESIRSERYLSPNQARNVGLARVTTPYVAFVNNDIEVTPGWLEALLDCARDTDASAVCPLLCVGKPLHQTILLAGGEARISIRVRGRQISRHLFEQRYFARAQVADVRDRLQRRRVEYTKLHCLLVKRELFDRVGAMDERLLSAREHVDFSLRTTRSGAAMYVEPSAVVTYVPPEQIAPSDLAYFSLRWSDEWERASSTHFQQKWQLHEDDACLQQRLQKVGQRRQKNTLHPLVRRLSFGQTNAWLEGALEPFERSLNRYLSDRHRKAFASESSSLNESPVIFQSDPT
ncbi:MAG: glycosyltransferase [Cyanobacteria bacterium J06639_1]